MPLSKPNEKTLEFISNWQMRSAKQRKTFVIVLAISLIIAVFVCLIGFSWYQTNNYNRTIIHSMNYVQDNAMQETREIESSMNSNVNIIKKYANQYAYLEKNYPESTVEENLHLLWDGTIFDRVSYVTKNGDLTSTLGTAEVSDREYFRKAMQGKSGYVLIEKSRVSNEPSLVFYAPVYIDDKINGIMLGINERVRIDHQLKYEFLNYEKKTYLLQTDGLVIGSSNDMYLSQNMFDVLRDREFSGDVSYQDVVDSINSKTINTIAFTFLEEGRRSIGVIAQFSAGNMMIFTVLPSEITNDMAEEANRAGRILLLFLTSAFTILIIVFFVFIVRQNGRTNSEMVLATENLKKTMAHDQKQSFIIESLSNTFSSVYFVSMDDFMYERIAEENETIISKLENKGYWHNGFHAYVSNFVDESYHEKMQVFMDIKKCAEHLESGEPLSIEYQRSDKEWLRAVLIPAEKDENNHIRSAIFAVQKIDAEKRKELDTKHALEDAYEAARLASNAKTTFLSNMSHDIRTPMNAIVGMTAIAGSNINNSEKVSECLKKINIASKHLLSIINEILDMSKIETGKVDLNEEEFHLPDLFEDLITINGPLIKEKKHTLTVKINALEHENVIGDSVRLQQVFTNLMSNAIKYTPEGGRIQINISEKQTNKPNIGWYEVSFIDNGIGMSQEFQEKMFEPFSRARDNRVSNVQGTGLGMSIARNIIRMMNGDITVKSKIDEGSTFTVSFALKLQNSKSIDYEQFTDLNVLVVDDDVTDCECTCEMLKSILIKGEYVNTGEEAVTKVEERHASENDYYAVIVDWKMPGMNGIQTAQKIREKIGDDIPIIVLSAYDWTEIEEEARSAGVDAFLSKPLFKSRLVNLFSDLVSQGGENAEAAEDTGEIGKQNFAGKRILLAEDNELNSEIAVEILSMMGLTVDTSENGKVCLEKFTKSEPGTYDLIFMDIQMPEMDGYQATMAIRASDHPQARTIPIIAMSANAFSTDVRNAMNSGMNGHVAKPIDTGAIIKVLNEMLK